MKEYLQQHPDAKVALDQLQYAVPWFDTYNTVAVRKSDGRPGPGDPLRQNDPGRRRRSRPDERRRAAAPYVEQTALKPLA
jgi:sn-glycerol 3-phosphate transport system substrate-binding protein